MTYEEAAQYLDSLTNYENIGYAPAGIARRGSFNLSRMEEFLKSIGDPQNSFKSIHVGGTKGKGSTCAFIYSILKEAGFKAGLYTSPHLASFRERIQINQIGMIPKEEVASLLTDLKPHIDTLTFFEVYTAVAFEYFKNEKIDFAIVEVGLGGRLDATNVINPEAVCITPISYDHMDILGDDIKGIALEKAGIIKKGVPVLTSSQMPQVIEVLRSVAAKVEAPLFEMTPGGGAIADRDIKYEVKNTSSEGSIFDYSSSDLAYKDLNISLLGKHQIENASLALGAIEILKRKGFCISEDSVRAGLKAASWPGRLEVLSAEPFLIVDGAQNKASALALIDSIEALFGFSKLILVFGASKDKDIEGIKQVLGPKADHIILTKSQSQRAAEPLALREAFRDFKDKLELANSADKAVDLAYRRAGDSDIILVTGSLYLVGEVRQCSMIR